MTMHDLAIVAAGLAAAGLVKGLTGIGFSTAALPFLVFAVGLKPAMALVTVPALISNFAVVASAGSVRAVVRRFWLFYVALLPGIAAGTFAMAAIDVTIAVQVLAASTLAYVGLALARPDLAMGPHTERLLRVPAGWLNGFLTGLTGSQVMPLMPFVMAARLAPDQQVQVVNIAVAIASSVLAAMLFAAGIMTTELLMLSVAGALPAIVGVVIGNAMRRWLSPGAFRHVALAVLAAIALVLNGRAATAPAEQACLDRAALAALAARTGWRVPMHAGFALSIGDGPSGAPSAHAPRSTYTGN